MKIHVVTAVSTFILLLLLLTKSFGQPFTRYDSLRGSINPLRACFDVTYYDLTLTIDPKKKIIKGSNIIHYKVKEDFSRMQIDLFSIMKIDSILNGKDKVGFERDSNVIYLNFLDKQVKDEHHAIQIFYSGKPLPAKNAPWDGGFVWTKDSLGNPWVGVACEGLGASSWWPCKDHFSDEPDSMRMTFTIPSGLRCISNGTLTSTKETPKGETSFTWKVRSPINTYNITLNIGTYAHFNESFTQCDGRKMTLDYYVLEYNKMKAQRHFTQVKNILKAYEHFFGAYAFPEDGYALVETPYWGMEHQSAISYGNNYENKLKDYDFIIVHETAHEWWGNSITASDVGELWIHESFATYSEALLLEYYYGLAASVEYLKHQQRYIKNRNPMLKPLGVNFFKSEDSDIYYKGAWMLHSLRNTIANDTLWFSILHDLSAEFKHSILTTQNVIDYFNTTSGMDLSPIFHQYLNYPGLPMLEYELKRKGKKRIFTYWWKADVENLNLPVLIDVGNEKKIRLHPSSRAQKYILSKEESENLRIMTELFYIKTKNLQERK